MTKVILFFRNSLILSGLAFALTGCQKEAAAPAQTHRATPVEVAVINASPLQLTTRLSGRTSAYRIAEVRPQVEGIIIKRLFVEGSLVKQGEILFQIDPATYEVALESANATLASREASLEKAKLHRDRYHNLLAKKAVSQQDYEDMRATYREAQAAVLAAKASVKSARINLDYTQIKAPISGWIGRSFVTEGALVTANQSSNLATIKQIDPLYIDISQSSDDLIKMRESRDSTNNKLYGINLTLDNGTKIKQQASLQFVDVTVDEETGTVNMRAILPNPDKKLLPGLYVRADVPTEMREKALLAPQAAVSRDTTGKAHVMIVNKQNKIEDRVIETSRVIDNNWLVDSGLQSGEKVVIVGLQKIRAGSTVQIINNSADGEQ